MNNIQNKTKGNDGTLCLQLRATACLRLEFLLKNSTTWPMVDIYPTVIQARSRGGGWGGLICIQEIKGISCNQACLWCRMTRHARWRSRWETYLKLCRTKWDRKWDSQLMVCCRVPCQTSLYRTLFLFFSPHRKWNLSVCVQTASQF